MRFSFSVHSQVFVCLFFAFLIGTFFAQASVDGLTAPLSCGLEEAVFYADQRASGVASLHESLAEKIPARRELCESFCSA